MAEARAPLGGWLRAAAALALAWCCSLAQAQVIEITRAQATVRVEDGRRWSGPVALPYHLDREWDSRSSRAEFVLQFKHQGGPAEPYGLYLPRVGNTAEIWINGTQLAHYGPLAQPDLFDYAKAPRYLTVPAALLRDDNQLRIQVAAEGGRRGGLSSAFIGPDSDVRPLFDKANFWRMTVSLAVAVVSLLVGTIALVLWFTQTGPGRGRDSIYLSAAVAEYCWALRVGDIYFDRPALPWPAWGVVLTAAFAGWICCIGLFCHHAAGWRRHPSARWFLPLLGLMFATAVLASWASYTLHQPIYLTVWLGTANLLFVVYAAVYLVAGLRRPSQAHLLVGLVGALNVAMGVRDWIAIRLSGDYSESTWIRYSSILFGMALVYIVVTRFRAVSAQAHDLTDTLAARVARKERELATSYERLEQMAREQERTAERTRILRDMHDGVGSHLSAAIRQLQSGRADDAHVLQTLRDALEQLKLSIDAMNLPSGDITALLAGLRYRLEPRFAASDVQLEWQVAEIAPLPRLDSAAMRHLQFMVFEALSNVLQHAQARVLRIEAQPQQEGARLRIVDDGRGFDVAAPLRPGLRAMHERAAAIGARLTLESRPGRTVVDICLPA